MTKKSKKKIAVIYHGDCNDGFGGFLAAYKKFGERADYYPLKNQSLPPDGLKDKQVFIIDFSFKKEILQKIERDNLSMVIIDHHMSAE
ncbi:MAG: hypothetical protein AAB645_01165, partial [Patescibacteria group bacterium]